MGTQVRVFFPNAYKRTHHCQEYRLYVWGVIRLFINSLNCNKILKRLRCKVYVYIIYHCIKSQTKRIDEKKSGLLLIGTWFRARFIYQRCTFFLNYAQLVHPLVYDIYLRYKQPNNPHSSRHIVYMQCYIGTHDFGLN